MGIDGQVYCHIWLFADPFKPPKCTTKSKESVYGNNKDASGARWLATTVWDYRVIESISVTYQRHSTAVCVLMEGITLIQLPTYHHHPPNIPPACPPL